MRQKIVMASVIGLVSVGACFSWVWGRSAPALPARQIEAPWDHVALPTVHTDHSRLIEGPLADGPAVTRRCLECHPTAARQVMATAHWTWAGRTVKLPGSDEPVQVGKKNLINNFCIAVGPNIAKCSSCHAGYGWEDDSFDFSDPSAVDCLICHDQTGSYQKGLAGHPEPEVDLVLVAGSVGRPTRRNCGACHFKGGGGDAVKHGDMDDTMRLPGARIDVHMGKLDFQCVDCHRTREHQVPGHSLTAGVSAAPPVLCTDCHSQSPHDDQRLDAHTAAVACQTCHIPRMAIDAPTKMVWDWSEAGQDDREEDPHSYMKKKGSFQYSQNIRPAYFWYNGDAYRYMTGQTIDPEQVVRINNPLGEPGEPGAKIWPFKVHRGKQLYDRQHRYLLVPKLWGPGGYWSDFDWDKAARLGAEVTGLDYSGEHGFVETVMFWPLSHMVQSKEKALQCVDCHGPQTILDWASLGYEADPARRGGLQGEGQ